MIAQCPKLIKIGEINQWGINMKEAKSVVAAKGWSGTITYTHLQQEVVYDKEVLYEVYEPPKFISAP